MQKTVTLSRRLSVTARERFVRAIRFLFLLFFFFFSHAVWRAWKREERRLTFSNITSFWKIYKLYDAGSKRFPSKTTRWEACGTLLRVLTKVNWHIANNCKTGGRIAQTTLVATRVGTVYCIVLFHWRLHKTRSLRKNGFNPKWSYALLYACFDSTPIIAVWEGQFDGHCLYRVGHLTQCQSWHNVCW